jgi:hypothetical protein
MSFLHCNSSREEVISRALRMVLPGAEACPLLVDGFEGGSTAGWSATVP